jgi:hypothetical protein
MRRRRKRTALALVARLAEFLPMVSPLSVFWIAAAGWFSHMAN